jgi:hypothetical protein
MKIEVDFRKIAGHEIAESKDNTIVRFPLNLLTGS